MPPSTSEPVRVDVPGDATGPRPLGGLGLGALLAIGGLIGLTAAVVLLVEKIQLIKDPDYVPSCSINPILSCGSVMTTPQAEAFGIPNPIIGIAGFAAIGIVGAAVLARATFHRWFWLAVQGGVTFAVVFVHWLIYQSLYVIGALCPYCMVVWAVTIPIFWQTTIRNLQPLRHTGPHGLRRTIQTITQFRGAILTAWFLTVLALIAHRFWDYWSTLF